MNKEKGIKRIALRASAPGHDPKIVTQDITVRQYPINITAPNGFENLYRHFETPHNSAIQSYVWDFGDGVVRTDDDNTTSHTYATSDFYTITLTLTLDDGSTIQSQESTFIGPGTRYIQGHTIYGDETWYSGGTYVVQGSIYVMQGANLTIEPGVRVELSNGDGFYIYGTLKATNVTFTRAGQTRWNGIWFQGAGSSGSKLENCVIEYTSGNCRNWSCGIDAIYIDHSSPTITGCTINNSTAYYGINIDNGSPVVSNTTVSGITNANGYAIGVLISGNASPTMTGNTIMNNNYGIMNNGSGGIYQGNTIMNNTSYGLYYSGSATIDATNCNWGDPSGPLDDSDDRATGGLYNLTGLGNRVSDHVNYYPWIGATTPPVPTGLAGTPEDSAINLTWNAVVSPSLDGYKIYYGTSSGIYGAPIKVGNVTSHKLTPLTNGIPYYIAISSVNTLGAESARSAEITVTPNNDITNPTSTITQPLNGSNLYTNKYIIKGTADDGTGSGVQKVEVSTDGGTTWNIASGTTSWSYAWVIPGVGTYTIKSRASDNAGNVEIPGAGITVTVVQRQPSTVSITNKQLLVNGQPFTVKGVVYSPVPIGDDPETMSPYGDYFTSDYSGIYNRDFPLLSDMSANTVRLWNWDNNADHLDFLDKAYNGGVTPIYVIAGYWINPGLDIDPNSPSNIREQLKADFREMVSLHKNHPAILMWAIGNDLNANDMYGNNLENLFSLINEMAQEAHTEEGANYHPVTVALADSDLINTIGTYNTSVPSLDIWGANVYRGNTFGSLFNDYKSVSTKPFVILEYGIDAYDSAHGNEYEKIGTPHQADYAEALWKEIETNSDTCIGGSIMAYSDEWWRGKYSTDPNCPDNDPGVHSTCGYASTSHPDSYANDEWWGIMRTKDNGTNPDIMEQRAVYYRLQSLWIRAIAIEKTGTGSGTVTSSDGKINCGSDCSETYNTVTEITLTAIPDTGSVFGGWSGCTPTPEDPKKCTVIVSNTITVKATFQRDTYPPTGSIVINGDAQATNNRSVVLTLSASDDSGGSIQMCISNTSSCKSWEPLATTKSWSLTSGNGTKTVYAWFRDQWGNVNTTPYPDTIILDTVAPVNGTVTATPGNTQVRLNWQGFTDALSGIDSYKVVYSTISAPRSCSSGTAIYTGTDTTYPHTGLTNGTTYYYLICAIDKAGNMSSGATTSVRPISETNPPTGSIVIDEGAEATNNRSVVLTLSASDDSGGPIQMCISNTSSCSSWEPFATTKSWSLTSGNGTKTVYARFRDQWGNVNTTPYSDTIILDTTSPVNGTVTATPGNTQVRLNWQDFTDALSGIDSYKVVYSTKNAPRSCSSGTAIYTGTDTTYPHTGLINGTTYGYRVCAIDKAGNMSSGATATARPVP
jgi:hypothetical protein